MLIHLAFQVSTSFNIENQISISKTSLSFYTVHGHLVTIEVGVENSTGQGMQLDGLALDQDASSIGK